MRDPARATTFLKRRFIGGLVLGQWDVADTLVGTCGVVRLEVFADEPTQVSLAKWDHAREQLASDAANEAFRESVQVRRKGRQLDRLNSRVTQDIACVLREDRVIVQDEVSLVTEESVEVVAQLSKDVGAPNAMALLNDSTERDDSSLEVDHEENLIAHETLPGENLNVEEVSSADMAHVCAKEGPMTSNSLQRPQT